MKISKTLVYFLIFTVISSALAYRLVMKSYDQYNLAEAQAQLLE